MQFQRPRGILFAEALIVGGAFALVALRMSAATTWSLSAISASSILFGSGVLIAIHDASSHFKIVRELALQMERAGLISTVMLPTPRGLVIAHKREGRT